MIFGRDCKYGRKAKFCAPGPILSQPARLHLPQGSTGISQIRRHPIATHHPAGRRSEPLLPRMATPRARGKRGTGPLGRLLHGCSFPSSSRSRGNPGTRCRGAPGQERLRRPVGHRQEAPCPRRVCRSFRGPSGPLPHVSPRSPLHLPSLKSLRFTPMCRSSCMPLITPIECIVISRRRWAIAIQPPRPAPRLPRTRRSMSSSILSAMCRQRGLPSDWHGQPTGSTSDGSAIVASRSAHRR